MRYVGGKATVCQGKGKNTKEKQQAMLKHRLENPGPMCLEKERTEKKSSQGRGGGPLSN